MKTPLSTKRVARTMRRGDEGVALVLALLFVVLLTALVIDFNYEMQVAASAVENHSSDTDAYFAAKSAVATGLAVLAADLLGGVDLQTSGQAQDLFDSLDEPWAEGIPLSPLNDALMQCTIADEYGKINLTALVYEDGSDTDVVYGPVEEMLRALFEYRGFEETSPVDAIIDWLDRDDDITGTDGAESEYYESLENRYGCKNGPMDSIEELLLIPGITPEVYYGDPEEEQLPLSDLLTVNGDPGGRINVNTAQYEVLVAYFWLVKALDPVVEADSTMTALLEQGPITNYNDLVSQFGNTAAGRNPNPQQNPGQTNPNPTNPNEQALLLDYSSSVFRVRGDGQSGEAQVRIEAYVWRDTYGNGSDQIFRVLDWRVYR